MLTELIRFICYGVDKRHSTGFGPEVQTQRYCAISAERRILKEDTVVRK